MKKILSSFVMAASLLGAVSVYAQTADEIVNKHIEAIGGKDVISKVNSIYMEGSMQVMGNDAPTTLTILNGKGYKTEADFNGAKSVQCYTDQSGWAMNPMAGGGAAPMPDEMYKSGREQINIGGALYDYAAKGSTVELQGKEGNNYKLKLTAKDKSVTTYFVDASTWYISKVQKKGEMMGQEVDINIQFSDYKKTDQGMVLPFTMNVDLGQFQLATTYTKATINKAIDPSVFAMPK